jgi:hypothetical protein
MFSSDTQKATPLPVMEAVLVFLFIMYYIWWLRFQTPSAWWMILGLILLSHLCHREAPAELGFRLANLNQGLAEFAPFLLFVVLALLAMGFLLHTVRSVTWDSGLSSLLFYFLWGLFQQYLLNGYFVNRFRLFFRGPEAGFVPVLAAVFFGGAHIPNWFLMGVTFVGGYVSARVYLKYGNLYLLGLAHGLIGFLLYLVVPDSVSHHLYVGPKWFSR